MANILLMGSDLLHGNLLLHGWHTSDVSFYPTELVQYALLESFLGLRMATAHVAAAMTYTLVVLLAVALARGGAPGGSRAPGVPRAERALRTLLAAGILLVPQLGSGVYALDVAVGHIGTSVPLLVIWLLLDRAGRRWWLPPLVAVLLGGVLVADPIAEITGVAPLLLVAGGRYLRRILTRTTADPYDAALAAAAVAGYLASLVAEAALRALGGYALSPLRLQLRGLSQLAGIGPASRNVLVLFGANFSGLHGGWLLLAVLHLASMLLVIATLVAACRSASMVDRVLLIGIVLNIGLYLATLASTEGAHEIAVAAPYAAALAARTLARPIRNAGARAKLKIPVTVAAAVIAGGYLAGFGCELTVPAAAPQNAPLAAWLQRHHFTSGLGPYWASSSVTVETGGRVQVHALSAGKLRPYLWMADTAWYDPVRHTAAFVIAQHPSRRYLARLAAAFGRPTRSYEADGFTILAYKDENLLVGLDR